MAISDPMGILLGHDRWATGEIILTCGGLAEEKFHRRFEMGPGSLHDTVVHTLWAMETWLDTLGGRELRGQEQRKWTVGEIQEHHGRVAGEFRAAALGRPLEEEVVRVRGGKAYTFTRGGVVMHVVTHSMHHRAQCLNMLRHVGVEKLPASSVAEWLRLGEPG